MTLSSTSLATHGVAYEAVEAWPHAVDIAESSLENIEERSMGVLDQLFFSLCWLEKAQRQICLYRHIRRYGCIHVLNTSQSKPWDSLREIDELEKSKAL